MGTSLVALAVLAVAFWLLERRFRGVVLRPRRASETLTDLAYWVLGPTVIQPLVRAIVIAAVVVWAFLLVGTTEPGALANAFASHSPIAQQPVWLQAIELLVLGDFLGYWIHRAFHRGSWWRVHAIHHGAERLDWLAAVRVHPLNDLLGTLLRVVPLYVLGFRFDLLAASLPLLHLHALLLHANVPWDFGPLRFVVSSPAFHRWHHAADEEGRDRNFAGLFPVWDLIFGTFFLPRGRLPARTGADRPVPDGFVAQLVAPWR